MEKGLVNIKSKLEKLIIKYTQEKNILKLKFPINENQIEQVKVLSRVIEDIESILGEQK